MDSNSKLIKESNWINPRTRMIHVAFETNRAHHAKLFWLFAEGAEYRIRLNFLLPHALRVPTPLVDHGVS